MLSPEMLESIRKMLMSTEPLQPKHVPPKADIQAEIERLIEAAGGIFNTMKKKAEESEVELDLEKEYEEETPYFPTPLSAKSWYATIDQYMTSELGSKRPLSKVAATVLKFEYPNAERGNIVLTLIDDEEQHAYKFATGGQPNYFDVNIVSVGKSGDPVRRDTFSRYAIRTVEFSPLSSIDSTSRTITVHLRKL